MNVLVFSLIAAPLTIATMALLAHALEKMAEADSRRPRQVKPTEAPSQRHLHTL